MFLWVLMILERQMFPKGDNLQVRNLLEQILGIWVISRVLGNVRCPIGVPTSVPRHNYSSRSQDQICQQEQNFFIPNGLWKSTSDVWTLSIVRSGYQIQVGVLPRLMLSPPGWCTRMPQDPFKMGVLRAVAEALLQKKAMKEVTSMHP